MSSRDLLGNEEVRHEDRYDYGEEGFPSGRPDVSAAQWLQAERSRHL